MHDFLERSRAAFWAGTVGLVVLFLFLIAFAGLGVSEVVWLSLAVLALAIAFAIHAVRVGRSLRAVGGGEDSMRALNRLRERRGF